MLIFASSLEGENAVASLDNMMIYQHSESQGGDSVNNKYPRPKAKASEKATDAPRDPNRLERVEHTYSELVTQPDAIEKTLQFVQPDVEKMASEIILREPKRVYIVGCGDSWFSGVGVKLAFEEVLGIPCEAVEALDFALYGFNLANEGTIVLGLSSSGTTTIVNDGLTQARSLGAYTIGVTNTPQSPLAKDYDGRLLIQATRIGWPTQASTAAMAAMMYLAAEIGKRTAKRTELAVQFEQDLWLIPDVVERTIDCCKSVMKEIALECVEVKFFQFMGAGSNFAAAAYGSAKIKELCPCHAVAFPLEEFNHYRTSKVGEPLFFVAPRGPSTLRAAESAEVARYDGGVVYAIVTEGDTEIAPFAKRAVYLPFVDEKLAPIVYSIPLHLLAYYVALAKAENDIGY